MKKTRIAVYISDVGFGHMIRQREIIKNLLLKFKNSEITIVNALQLEILEKHLKINKILKKDLIISNYLNLKKDIWTLIFRQKI